MLCALKKKETKKTNLLVKKKKDELAAGVFNYFFMYRDIVK